MLKARLIELFSDILDIAPEAVTDELSKNNCDEWDSFNHLVLINETEQRFNVSLTIEESEKIDSFDDMLRLLERKTI